MNKLYMMVGLPGSGKSTYAKELSIKENAIVYASDNLRGELFENEDIQNRNNELFTELHKRIKQDLSEGKNVIYDATNISYKRRKAFLEEIKKFNTYKICCLKATPYDKCLEQNENRGRFVPEHIIKKMYLNFDIPAYFEGWDEIQIHYTDNTNGNWNELFARLDKIDQDNPNHTFPIGIHCKSCATWVCSDSIQNHIPLDENILKAAMLHDIGKEFTKQFKNYKGEVTDIAHYYHHENISAYDALFYLRGIECDSILDICQLIRYHMQPFFINTEKAKQKFINLVGQEFYDRLMILHEADKKAK